MSIHKKCVHYIRHVCEGHPVSNVIVVFSHTCGIFPMCYVHSCVPHYMPLDVMCCFTVLVPYLELNISSCLLEFVYLPFLIHSHSSNLTKLKETFQVLMLLVLCQRSPKGKMNTVVIFHRYGLCSILGPRTSCFKLIYLNPNFI